MARPLSKPGYLGEIVRGSIIGTIDISIEILRGAFVLPKTVFFAPSFFCKMRLIKEKKELTSFASFAKTLKDYPYRVVGTGGIGFLSGYYSTRIYEFLRDNPVYLVIPLITNILSAGYQRYTKNKDVTLEERI